MGVCPRHLKSGFLSLIRPRLCSVTALRRAARVNQTRSRVVAMREKQSAKRKAKISYSRPALDKSLPTVLDYAALAVAWG